MKNIITPAYAPKRAKEIHDFNFGWKVADTSVKNSYGGLLVVKTVLYQNAPKDRKMKEDMMRDCLQGLLSENPRIKPENIEFWEVSSEEIADLRDNVLTKM